MQSTRACCNAIEAALETRDFGRAAEALERLRTAVNAGADVDASRRQIELILTLALSACEACWRS